ncbi:replicative DNA helicase [Pseudomonas typographi]|uniref:replicative DNA helicase n=1 Tax=Pseudomonas typographi TaxID=2715964 RepID=UPI00168819AA|nr:replicative DNA helicase [Pseudomonas typographi]MBD1554684.1 replicative DNA helicase [Pseudomonas typographi]MBD1590235.1 replicative DNA helicase [Pseudomonas typographi]
MREPYSLEAEHGLLGAMMQRPELIDTLSDDLTAEAFYFAENAEVFRAIKALRSASKAVDFLTVGEHIGQMPNGDVALAYCAEIVDGTPSVASASTYARIVRERAIDRALMDLGQRTIEIAQGEQDTQTKVGAIQSAALAIDAGMDSEEIVKASDVLTQQVEVWQDRHDRMSRGETLVGLSTGLKDLDAKLGGLQPEQLIIVAGRPAMGKTTLAMGWAIHAAVHQKKCALVISLEMSKGQLIDRAVACEGRIPLNLIKNGSACQSHGTELGAASRLIHRSNLFFSDKPGSTVSRIRAAARRHKMRYGLDLLVIDYLQLMEGDGGNRTEEVSGMSRGCKLLARELGIPVVLLSQLSRKCEDRPNKRPIPSDLRESGAIEQDADVVVFVYRDEVYNEHSEARGIAEIIIGKGRDVETGTVRAAFLGQYNRFENLAAGWAPPPQEESPKVTSMASRYARKEGRA